MDTAYPIVKKEIETKVREMLAEATGNVDLARDIEADTPLFTGDAGLDSVDLVSFIVLVERGFMLSFPQEADFSALFFNIDSIIATILSYLPVEG